MKRAKKRPPADSALAPVLDLFEYPADAALKAREEERRLLREAGTGA